MKTQEQPQSANSSPSGERSRLERFANLCGNGDLRFTRGQFNTALLVLLAGGVITAGCEENSSKEQLPPECETDEHKEMSLPRVEITKEDQINFDGKLLTVGFTVPEFDAQCRAPLYVSIKAITVVSSQHAGELGIPADESLSDQIVLGPGPTEVWEPGKYTVIGEKPQDCNYIKSFTLTVEATDEQGNIEKVYETAPVLMAT